MSSPPEEDEGGGVRIPIREWELNETSTTYDRLVAAPSDATIESQWILFLAILILSLIWMIFVFGSVSLDPKCRKNPFNTYIVFLMGPDILFALCCTISCALNLSLGRYVSVDGCIIQSLYAIFAITSSAWINAIVVYQLHKMLWCSRKAIRYHPPTRKQVVQQCLLVYIYSMFLASWPSWGRDESSSWWPIRNNLYSGIFCLPMPYDLDSTLFFYLLFAPMVFIIPFLYICYVVLDMIYNQLLPHRRDQRKTLMVLLRLLLVYFVMWVPALGLVFVGGNFLNTWWVAIGGAWAHLQGAVSAAILFFKPDIRMACQKTLVGCCCCCRCCCLHGQTIHSRTTNTKKNKRHTNATNITDPAMSHSFTTREDPAMGVLDEENDDDDIEFQNQRSCELFLGITDEGNSLRTNDSGRSSSPAATTTRKKKHKRSNSFSKITTTPSGRRIVEISGGGVVRTSSAYELAMGLEPGELSSALYTIPSREMVVQGEIIESA